MVLYLVSATGSSVIGAILSRTASTTERLVMTLNAALTGVLLVWFWERMPV